MTSPRHQAVPGHSSSSSLSNDIDPWGAGSSRHGRTLSTLSTLSQSPGTSSPLRRRRPRENGQRGSIDGFDDDTPPPHPLTSNGLIDLDPPDSRPTLTRLLSETERQVAESSTSGASSTRGSLDLLRMSKAEEVEVFIHQVKANESLAGIALLYGIDLPTLRKINKLWPSDPVHLRTHLYIPLEACRWNKASETFTRGPGEGQATLTPKTPYKGKGKARASMDSGEDALDLLDLEPDPRASMDTLRPTPPTRVLDIVRIPSSQLSFFPRPQTSGRPSLEFQRRSLDSQKLRRTASLSSRVGPDIHHDLMTLPSPLKPPDTHSPKSKFVRLRPPTAPTRPSRSDSLADKLSSLFTVPPPPSTYASLPSRPPRASTESLPSSPRPSPIIKQPEVLLEMSPREPRRNRKKDN